MEEIKNETESKEFDFSLFLKVILTRWKTVMFFALIGILTYIVIARYSSYIYSVNSMIYIDVSSETPTNSLILQQPQENSGSDQIEVIKSKEVLSKLIELLPLKTVFFKNGSIRELEYYKNSPFEILYYDSSTVSKVENQSFQMRLISNSKFELSLNNKKYIGEFEKLLKVEDFSIVLKKTKLYNDLLLTDEFSFVIYSDDKILEDLQQVSVSLYKGNKLFLLKLDGLIPIKISEIINTLVSVYLNDELNLKQKSINQKIAFIDTLLMDVKGKVDNAESKLEKFERNYDILDISGSKGTITTTISGLEDEKNTILLQKRTLDQLESYIKNIDLESTEIIFAPTILDIADGSLTNYITQFNQLLNVRKNLLQKFTLQNKELIKNKSQIEAIRNSIIDNIQNQKYKITTELKYVNKKYVEAKMKMGSIPSIERELSTFQKPFEMNSKIYYELINKRTELQIEKAAVISKSRIIKPASIPDSPVKPKKSQLLLTCLFIGIVIGVAYVVYFEISKETIGTRSEVEAKTFLPIIGVILKAETKVKDLNFNTASMKVLIEPKSQLSENFRSVRAHLQFVLNSKKKKIIAVTSTISTEGKSFVSTNLAGILSLLEKPVIIVDLDLRKPRLHQVFRLPNELGIVNFMNDQNSIEEIFQYSGYDNLKVITSGPVPPNPAELLSEFYLNKLFTALKEHFDVIICDTAPIGLVTDTISIVKTVDLTIYVFKANFSKRMFLKNAELLKREHNIKNLYIILNYASPNENTSSYGYSYGYGSGYGYGYGSVGGYNSGYYLDGPEYKGMYKYFFLLRDKIKNFFKK